MAFCRPENGLKWFTTLRCAVSKSGSMWICEQPLNSYLLRRHPGAAYLRSAGSAAKGENVDAFAVVHKEHGPYITKMLHLMGLEASMLKRPLEKQVTAELASRLSTTQARRRYKVRFMCMCKDQHTAWMGSPDTSPRTLHYALECVRVTR